MSSQVAKVLTVCGIALGDASDYEIAIAQRAVQLYRFEEAVKYFWTITRGPPCKRSLPLGTPLLLCPFREPRLDRAATGYPPLLTGSGCRLAVWPASIHAAGCTIGAMSRWSLIEVLIFTTAIGLVVAVLLLM